MPPSRNSMLCPNCRKLISSDEKRCPFCGLPTPGSKLKNNPLTRHWGNGEQLVRWIIYVNVAMYLISLLIDPQRIGIGFNPLSALSPSLGSLAALGATGVRLVHNGQGWWTLLAANYLHGSILHIFFNLVALYQLSPLITQLYGPYRYFVIFTFSGIFGFWVSYLAGVGVTIGASAALCGLIGAALYFGKTRGGPFGQAVYRQIGGWAVIILVFGFLVSGVNNWAHLGGMVAGALSAMVLGYQEKRRETLIHRYTAGAMVVATVLALGWGIVRGVVFWIS